MTIDKQKLRALAEAATQSYGARRVEVDHNGVHVIGDGSWKILSAWHTPDGKGAQNAEFAAAASPSTVLDLLAEIERLERKNANQAQSIREYQDMTMGGDVSLGMLKADLRVTAGERDQLKADNETLRKSIAGKVVCDLELFEDLRDSAAAEADGHRQSMGSYRPQRQEVLDHTVSRCDLLIAAAKEASNG